MTKIRIFRGVRSAAVFAAAVLCSAAFGFQIAPLGSKFEAKLTNETESRLAEIAGRLGVLIKSPVHEEILQLGFGCPVHPGSLESDDSCKGGDAGFANQFVIYGVRWNDLPPFMLNPGQGARCRKLGFLSAPACNTSQTVRFSTQPDCWYCLFNEAATTAQTKKITGCEKGEGFVQGTLMTRSHFGDLQFFHAMARDEGTVPEETQAKIRGWIEFAWKVSSKEILPNTWLKDVDIPTIREHFGCSSWTAADIYVLGRSEWLLPRLPDIAFGSVVHTVQDSFAAAHVTREPPAIGEACGLTLTAPRPGRVVEFHTYGSQDSKAHDEEDSRAAMALSARDVFPEAVEATKQLFSLYDSNASWQVAEPYFKCVFELSPDARPASAGVFRKAGP